MGGNDSIPSMADETTVVVQNQDEPEGNDPDVAAVAAGASGVALAESINAQQQARDATEAAQEATAASVEAQVAAMSLEERTARLEKILTLQAMRAEVAAIKPPEPAPEPEPVPEPEPQALGPPEQEPPKSVGGKGKKRTFRERWEGSGE